MEQVPNHVLKQYSEAVLRIHNAKSTSLKNRYQLQENLWVWYENGLLTQLHTDTLSFDLVNLKQVPYNTGNKGFYVEVIKAFDFHLTKLLECDLSTATKQIECCTYHLIQGLKSRH